MNLKQKMMKRVISLVLLVSIVFGMSYDIMAVENNWVKVDKENIDECVIIAALDWATFLHPELDMEIGDIHQINVAYNSSEIEYTVVYFVGVVPYGYAVVSFCDGQAVIKEATIEKGVEGIYTNLIDVVDENSDIASQDLDIKGNVVELAPMKYCVITENDEEEIVSYDNYGVTYGEDEITYGATYTTINGFYIKNSDWTSSNYVVDPYTKETLDCYEGKWIFSQESALINTGRYACAVQALYNISHWWGINGYSATTMQREYIKLWNYTNTYQIASPQGEEAYLYGETTFDGIKDGFVKYLKEKGYKYTTTRQVVGKPTKAWIRTRLKDNEPIVYNYVVESASGVKTGHTIAIIGVMNARKVSSGNTWTYLMVADGWRATPTYFNYDYVELESYSAMSFKIE